MGKEKPLDIRIREEYWRHRNDLDPHTYCGSIGKQLSELNKGEPRRGGGKVTKINSIREAFTVHS